MASLPPFTVTAHWDDEAAVWVSETDIRGLVIEADTLDEFEALVFALAPDVIAENYLRPRGLADRPAAEVMSAIIWKRPLEAA